MLRYVYASDFAPQFLTALAYPGRIQSRSLVHFNGYVLCENEFKIAPRNRNV
jgi:hypothetical protein